MVASEKPILRDAAPGSGWLLRDFRWVVAAGATLPCVTGLIAAATRPELTVRAFIQYELGSIGWLVFWMVLMAWLVVPFGSLAWFFRRLARNQPATASQNEAGLAQRSSSASPSRRLTIILSFAAAVVMACKMYWSAWMSWQVLWGRYALFLVTPLVTLICAAAGAGTGFVLGSLWSRRRGAVKTR